MLDGWLYEKYTRAVLKYREEKSVARLNDFMFVPQSLAPLLVLH